MEDELKYTISLEDLFSLSIAKAEASAHKFERTLDGVQSHTQKVGAQMKKESRGYFGSFFQEGVGKLAEAFALYELAEKMVEFGKQSFELAEKQADAEKKLLVAVNDRKDVQEAMIRSADELMYKTGKDDEEIIRAQTNLITSGRSVGESNKIISVAMGYARVKGKDWQNVVKQLQDTYVGAKKELGRYEKAIHDMTDEQLRNGEAVDFLAEKYKNFMDGANLTSAEKLKRLGTMWEETKESLGGFVGELMEASNFTDHWTSVLKNLSVELKSSESAWTKFGMVLDALAGGSYNVVQAKIEENRNEAATRYYEEAEKEGKKSDAARVKYYELAKKVAEKRLSDELSLFGDANSTDYDKSKVEEAIKQYKYQIDLITRAAKKSQDKRLEAFRTAKLTGDEAGLGAGMSEPKEGKFQQITITINNPFQNMKNTYANMEAGVNDFMGQLGQALNKVVQDAGILATE